jgi:hypothetical protein
MMLPLTLAGLAAPAVAGPDADRNAAINAALPADQAAMKSHVMFLASDALKGREAGTPEFDIAAHYVASQFYEAGLRPAGDEGSYLQKVPLVSYRAADHGSFTLAGAVPETLVFGDDYLPGTDPVRPSLVQNGDVVFVGYGIAAPQFGRDDYRGIDVTGKIVAYFGGAPASYPGEERAHFGSPATKAVLAASHGAVGVITLESPRKGGRRPYSPSSWDRPTVTWADAAGKPFLAGAPTLARLSQAGTAKLFRDAKTPWDEVAKRAAGSDDAVFKPEQLPWPVTIALNTASTPLTSYNVAGIIPGADPVLAQEVVVLSAHLDHIGITKADAKGDAINNGALDDAVGIASLIEEARRFKASGKPPRRSILFLAVTAEEKGLVGSDYFARHPTVPKGSIVADVNLDMPIITYKFSDLIVFGAPRSTLGPIVERAAAGIGVTISADPLPDEGLFVRSDHYRFVQQGVPSVFLWPGAGGPGKAAIDAFMKDHYHKPSDDLAQDPPIDWESGVRFIEVNYRIAREIADGDQRPVWNKGDFFGTLYGGLGAK